MTAVVADGGPDTCLERVLTTRLVEPHLGAPGVALDLAGGNGPYAVWLKELGWDVRAWPGGLSFDAVIGLGLGLEPSLCPSDDDLRALARVTRPGGILALATGPLPGFGAPGFATVTRASTHGFMAGAEERLDALRLTRPDAYRDVLDRLVATADDPAVVATASRLLWVGRRYPR